MQMGDPKVLEPGIATVDGFMRKYDLANSVDFGCTDQCRFYTSWMSPLYLGVFRLNPEKDGNSYLPRDRDGAEVAFRMEKYLKMQFMSAWGRDVIENFQMSRNKRLF
ncbi:unnamed protein product [Rotaria magnacalcarata]|nr:unnamed protein product [Rotaria magnacalcarata]